MTYIRRFGKHKDFWFIIDFREWTVGLSYDKFGNPANPTRFFGVHLLCLILQWWKRPKSIKQ